MTRNCLHWSRSHEWCPFVFLDFGFRNPHPWAACWRPAAARLLCRAWTLRRKGVWRTQGGHLGMWLPPLLPAVLVTLVWRQLSSSWMRLRSWSPVWIFNSFCTKSVLQPLSYGLSHRFHLPLCICKRWKKKKNPKGKLDGCLWQEHKFFLLLSLAFLPRMSTERNSRYVPQN